MVRAGKLGTLAQLIWALDEIEGLARIRFTLASNDMDDALNRHTGNLRQVECLPALAVHKRIGPYSEAMNRSTPQRPIWS